MHTSSVRHSLETKTHPQLFQTLLYCWLRQGLFLEEMVTLALCDSGSICNLCLLLMTECEREIVELNSTTFHLAVVSELVLLDS